MRSSNERYRELGNFLRARRARISPQDVGLPGGGRRRTPGLRREEVAQLAGIGVAWYTNLEQGREIGISTQTLASIARVLQLNAQEQEYLFVLAHQQRPLQEASEQEILSSTLQHFLDQQGATAAYVVGRRWDIVAWNEAAKDLFGAFPLQRGRERNELWRLFTQPSYRALFVDWEEHARSHLTWFRADCGHLPGDAWFTHFVNDLMSISPQFRAWWAQHNVAEHTGSRKLLRHPTKGQMLFEHFSFQIQSASGLRLVVYMPLHSSGGK